MIKSNIYIKALVFLMIILLFLVTKIFSQMPFEPGRKELRGKFVPPVVMGEVIEIHDKSIVILTQEGDKIECTITSQALFIKEIRAEKSRLRKGDNLLVIGQAGKGNFIYPIMIKILSVNKGDKMPIQPQHLMPSDRGAEAIGPFSGMITVLDPLTVESISGDKKIIKITEATKFLKETPAKPSEIKEGTKVRVMAPPKPGMKSREALKIIVLFEERPSFRKESRSAFGAIPTREVSALNFLDSPFGFLTAPPQPDYLFDLNVNWMVTGIRLLSWEEIESRKGEYDFSSADKRLVYLYKNGVNTIIELRAINPLYGTPSGRREVRGVSFPEEYLSEWSRFIEKLVGRYDGDGIDDAPGSPTVKNYQLIHELLMPGHGKKDFWREHPDKYVKFFKITYDAIKKSCSDCTLYFIGGFEEDFMFKGEKTIKGEILREDGFFVNVLKEFQKQGIHLNNLGFDYHYWSFWLFRPEVSPETYRDHLRIINHIKRLYKFFGYTDDEVSIISKESGVNGYLETEREQAIYLIKIYATTIASGQKHLFWTSMVEYAQEAGFFLGVGLIHNPLNHGYTHKKLAYYTYKLMVEKLKDSGWKNVETIIDGEHNVYVYKFPGKKSQRSVYIVWWDYFRENEVKGKKVKLNLNLSSGEVTVTSAIPDAKNGLGIDKVNFKTETAKVKEGSLSILLGEDPVYIEEGIIPQPLYKDKKINPEILDRLLD